MRAAGWFSLIAISAVAALGCGTDPAGETFCVHIDSAGLQSVSVTGVGGSSSYKLIAKKIGD
ncbi:MAG: hypothetical protein IPQ07_02075 [Myxococcales bacterium]|nr:hypothetical protein [Myxococcales bacterium]